MYQSAAEASTPHQRDCDIAIVGWGPVGQLLATLLAQRGMSVTVFERWPERYSLSRAGHCDGETFRTFQLLGIAEQVELVVQPNRQWSLVDADREVLAKLTLNDNDELSGWKASYLSHQPELEEIFEARAQTLGVRIVMGTTVEGLVQDDDGVTFTVRPTSDPGGATETIRAAFVIGADGANSFVRSVLGLDRLDLGFSTHDELVIDFEYNDPDIDLPQLPEVYQVLDVNRPLLAGRWSGSRWSRFEFAAVDGESRDELESEAKGWELLSQWGITPDLGRITRHAVYAFESRVAEKWRDGRVLLVGDAAHTMPPFLGQGMCSGVRDALNLAWKLDAVLSGAASPDLLDTYESERRPHLLGLTEMAMGLGEMLLERDSERGRQRDESLRAGNLPRAPRFPRIGPGVVLSPETDPDGLAGRPSPQARVALHGRVDRLDEFHQRQWRIVSRHAVPLEMFTREQRAVLDATGMAFAHVTRGAGPDDFSDIDADYDIWFRANNVKAFICRPDNYMFGAVSTPEDLPALVDELGRSLTAAGWRIPELAASEGGPS